MKGYRITFGMFLAFMIMAFTSCNESLTYPSRIPAEPYSSTVRLKLDWSNALDQLTEADSVTVVAYRMVNEWWSAFRMCAVPPYEGHYTYNHPSTSWEEDSLFEDTVGCMKIRQGDYRFYVFSTNYDPRFTASETENSMVDNAVDGYQTVSFLTNSIIYNPLTRGEMLQYTAHEAFQDYNPYSDYVLPTPTVLYSDSIEYASIHSDDTITFSPKNIAQRVNIRFPIEKTQITTKFVIDSVICELAGVSSKMYLSNRQLNTDVTYKVIYDTDLTDSEGNSMVDDADNTLVYSSASIDIIGLINSTTASNTQGPGIMQAQIYIHTLKSDGSVNNRVCLPAIVNLHNVIANLNFTRKDIHGVTYQGDNIVNMIIDTPVVINGRTVVLNDKSNGDLIKWTTGGTIHIDI